MKAKARIKENLEQSGYKGKKVKEYYFTLQLNAPLQPICRETLYEIPIGKELEHYRCGGIVGGGTSFGKNGEIESCDLEIYLFKDSKSYLNRLIKIIDEIGVPKGSVLRTDGFERSVGRLEGLALYLNSEEFSKTDDVISLLDKIIPLLGDAGKFFCCEESSSYAILYFYGSSFEQMKALIEPHLANYPSIRIHKPGESHT